MPTRGWNTLQHTTEHTRRWIDAIRQEMGGSEQEAWHALRAVLHTLRDRILATEAADLAAQLPMLVRGLFYEGWRPGRPPEALDTEASFLARVGEHLRGGPPIDPRVATRAVFRVIGRFVTWGEVRQVIGQLPAEVRDLWPAPVRA